MAGGATGVLVAAVAFVGTHFLLSHPLRAPSVRRLGEGGFLGLYSVVAALTLGWLAVAYLHAPPSPPLWPVGGVLWAAVTVLMLLASMLLLGSLIRNPAAPAPGRDPAAAAPEARGVFAITRHPMLWSFAIWAACHAAVYPVAANLVLSGAIAVLSLVGAALQDRKKRRLAPGFWRDWEARTSFLPGGALLAGRARVGRLGPHVLAGGTVVWLAATWAHGPLAGWRAGIWRWI